jgi:hypothetical protein
MMRLYELNEMSRQAFHDRLNRHYQRQQEEQHLLQLIRQIREDHPKMSARMMYLKLHPQTMGRDRFEVFCFENGFKVQCKRNYRRTTNSNGVIRFDNLIQGLELTGVNQVWVSDITYYELGNEFCYLTFFMDLFSRLIVGYSASQDLRTENTTIPAFKMACKVRGANCLIDLIIHSDGGGQYYSREFIKITKKVKHSMSDSVYENPHAERINGIIKNDYLYPYNPKDFPELVKMLKRAVNNYNNGKPHGSLKKLSPVEFEKSKIEKSTNQDFINKRKKEAKKEKLTQHYIY